MSDSFLLTGLRDAEADEQVRFYEDNGGIAEKIPEGGGLFSVKVSFLAPPSPGSSVDWSSTPTVGQSNWHSRRAGFNEWRHDSDGVYLRQNPTVPVRSNGSPVTCSMIMDEYASDIFRASITHGVPPEIIIMTIATETAMFRQVKFTGPKTFRWEPRPRTYSAGPMQILATTARRVIREQGLGYDPDDVAPSFASEPSSRPARLRLYEGDVNIDLGTAYIKGKLPETGLDPILVAAAYNAGSLKDTTANAWGLVHHGDHLDRAGKWFGDACFLMAALRRGEEPDTAPQGTPDPSSPNTFELTDLAKDVARKEAEFYRDSGATVELRDQQDGLFALRITYASAGEAPPPPETAPPADIPDLDGYVVLVDRIRSETRAGAGFPRTVSSYRVFFNRQPVQGLFGFAAERQGPGDNSSSGRRKKARIVEGTYPLFTHAGSSGRYKTFGFSTSSSIGSRPWPSVKVGSTGAREGILIHCANGYLMSEGCINLASSLPKVSSDIVFSDSRNRVISLIDSMRAKLGGSFPSGNNQRIPNAWLVVRGEP